MAKYGTHDVDTDKFGGLDLPEPGAYHFEVIAIDEECVKGGTEAVEVQVEILAGTPGGQEGKTHKESFFLRPKQIPRLLQFAAAVGLTSKEEVERCKAAGEDVEFDWQDAVRQGRQFCGKLQKRKDQNGNLTDFLELGFQFFPVDDKRAKGIPLNKEKLQELAARLKGQGSGGNGNGQQAQQPAATETQPAAPFGDSDADDLF